MAEGSCPKMWLVEKKVIRHKLDLGYERIQIPVRVKFEYEVKDGSAIINSLTLHLLYNQQILAKRYPQLDLLALDASIHRTAKREILNELNQSGLLRVDQRLEGET